MKEIVAAPDLRIGMFVAELDRPWLESPFLMQGFVVEDEETLAQLDDWRSRLRCPLHFGAPFGFLEDGDFFCLVGIRSLYWQGQRLALCTGGGVVASSTLTHEWRELKLKRDTVRRSFRLP